MKLRNVLKGHNVLAVIHVLYNYSVVSLILAVKCTLSL